MNNPDRSIPPRRSRAATWQAARNPPCCDRSHQPGIQPRALGAVLQHQLLAASGDPRLHGTRSDAAAGGGAPRSRAASTATATTRTSSPTSRCKFGKVLTLQARLPTTPQDLPPARGEWARAQVRFWSLCTGESRVTLRTPDCVSDRELPVNSRSPLHRGDQQGGRSPRRTPPSGAACRGSSGVRGATAPAIPTMPY